MSINFNADEVLAMAERIEEDGAAFYRKAAELRSGDTDEAGFLQGLAEMEDKHKATFSAMRGELTDRMLQETAFDPYMEAALYLQAMADGHGGEGAVSVADSLTAEDSLADIIKTAIGLEHKSIVFYLGLRDMVPPKLGQDKIDAIIAEEKSHVVTLTERLRAVLAA